MELRPIPGFPSYSASADGTIFRNGRMGKDTSYRPVFRPGGAIKSRDNGHGYQAVILSERGKRIDAYVHRLVCLAFHGAPPTSEHDCRHKNGRRSDNAPSNLGWATKLENEADKFIHETNPAGERHPASVLTDEIVLEAREMAKSGMKIVEIAKALGFGRLIIRDAVRGDRWRHLPNAVPKPERRSRDIFGRYL